MKTGKKSTRTKELFEYVYELTRQVPKGKVTTYAAIADVLDMPRAARVVGFIMSVCPYPERVVPCHRVIRSDGSLGGYGTEGVQRKRKLLSREGIEIENGKIDLSRFLFYDFPGWPERRGKSKRL